jgi:pimeloyl-ACP methyl ester carboxylesterase
MSQQQSKTNDHVIPLPGGRRLGYAEYGESNGYPVLFFHGAPGSSHLHPDLAKIAAQNNVHLIAVDRPGYGLSDPQPNRSFLNFADDVNALTKSLGVKKFSIIGFSAGSPYPLACAYKFPARINKVALVAALVPGITDGMPPMVSGLYVMAQTNPDELRKTFAAVAPSSSVLLDVVSSTSTDWDKKVLLDRAVEFELEYEHTLKNGIEGMVSDFVLNSGNWGFPINECHTEVHLYSGSLDQNTPPAMTHYLATQLPNSHVHAFQDEGHFILYPHWDEILKQVK